MPQAGQAVLRGPAQGDLRRAGPRLSRPERGRAGRGRRRNGLCRRPGRAAFAGATCRGEGDLSDDALIVCRIQHAVPLRGPAAERRRRSRRRWPASPTPASAKWSTMEDWKSPAIRSDFRRVGRVEGSVAKAAAMVKNKWRNRKRCGACSLIQNFVTLAPITSHLPCRRPTSLILRAPGTNCDQESALGLPAGGGENRNSARQPAAGKPAAAGAVSDPLHSRRLQLRRRRGRRPHPGQPNRTPPGRAAGPVQGCRQIDPGHLQRFSGDDPSGILLPADAEHGPPATLTLNDSGKYEDRWVRLRDGGRQVRLPPRHRVDVPAGRPCRGEVCRPQRRRAGGTGVGRATGAARCIATRCIRPILPAPLSRQSQRFDGRRGRAVRPERPRAGSDAPPGAAHRSHAASPLDPRRGRPGGRRVSGLSQRGGVFS